MRAVLMLNMASMVAAAVPLYEIVATTPYGAGLQHGQLAKAQIRGWLASGEMTGLAEYASTPPGSGYFAELQRTNTEAFPEQVNEMAGIADGAVVPLRSIWLCNVLYELEALRGEAANDHCTDVYVKTDSGAAVLGHNEDWSKEVKPFWYWIKQDVAGKSKCAGLAYPGTLIGYAGTWSEHGIFTTMNSLFPFANSAAGLSAVFVQRAAICESRNMSQLVVGLSRNMSSGASVNMMDANAAAMANLEVYEAQHALFAVPARANYSHENNFKQRPFAGKLDAVDASSFHRQARLDALPAPRSSTDVLRRLGDTNDPKLPLYRPTTLATLVMDSSTNCISAWENANPSKGPPTRVFNLSTFFQRNLSLTKMKSDDVEVLHGPVVTRSLIVDGLNRTYEVQTPTGPGPWPLILSFHGDGGTGAGQAKSDMLRLVAGGVAIIVHPQGEGTELATGKHHPTWNGGGSSMQGVGAGAFAKGKISPDGETCNQSWTKGTCDVSCSKQSGLTCKTDVCWWSNCFDDAKFVAAMIAQLKAEHKVDKIYMTGDSNGSMFLYTLIADARVAPAVAAVAPVSGIPHNGFLFLPLNKQLRYLNLWGTKDTYVVAKCNVPGRPDKSFSSEYGWYYSCLDNCTRTIAKSVSSPGAQKAMRPAAAVGASAVVACRGWAPASSVVIGNETSVADCSFDGPHGWPYDNGSAKAHWAARLVVEFFLGAVPPAPPPPPSVPCPLCGAETCDGWIRSAPEYSCSELKRDYHCNCTGCELCGQSGPTKSDDENASKCAREGKGGESCSALAADGAGDAAAAVTLSVTSEPKAAHTSYPTGDPTFGVLEAFPGQGNLDQYAISPFLLAHEWGKATKKIDGRVAKDDGPPVLSDGAAKTKSVGWHPHRGFDLITYAKEGRGSHADSLGNVAIVRPGGVQWMRSGSGIEHAEGGGNPVGNNKHGFQLWINLPGRMKMDAPAYGSVQPEDVPEVKSSGGGLTRIIAGAGSDALGDRKDMIIIDCELPANTTHTLRIAKEHAGTVIVYAYVGGGVVGGKAMRPHETARVGVDPAHLGGIWAHPKARGLLHFKATHADGLAVMVFAGKDIGEQIAWQGPIVMNTDKEIQEAYAELQDGSFYKKRASYDYQLAADESDIPYTVPRLLRPTT